MIRLRAKTMLTASNTIADNDGLGTPRTHGNVPTTVVYDERGNGNERLHVYSGRVEVGKSRVIITVRTATAQRKASVPQ
ncbi:MAG: hypothetical protein R3C17_20895 [Planctomycetaceae bacterium]